MVFLKTVSRCKLFIVKNRLENITRPSTSSPSNVPPIRQPPSEATPTLAPAQVKIIMPRPVRQEPGKVKLGMIPVEWIDFFYPKTGLTGPYVFVISISTYLISKEYYVLEHNYYAGLSMIILTWITSSQIGKPIAKAIDKEIDKYEKLCNQSRAEEKSVKQQEILEEEQMQKSSEGQMMVLDAKKEIVHLQREAAFRARLLHVHKEVKAHLDYQGIITRIHTRFHQRNLIQWVICQIIQHHTAEKAAASIDQCIEILALLKPK